MTMAAKPFDLTAELLSGNSRVNRDRVARWVGSDPQRFAALMKLYLHGDRREAQLAAGVVSICVEHHPALANPWLSRMLRRMQDKDVHDAVRRMGMWVFQFVDIPSRLAGRLAQVSFDALQDVSQPIAMRVFAMTVLTRLSQDQPDLSREVRTVIEAMIPYSTVAFAARARRELKRLGGSSHAPHADTGMPQHLGPHYHQDDLLDTLN
jgi:hypothetical protein